MRIFPPPLPACRITVLSRGGGPDTGRVAGPASTARAGFSRAVQYVHAPMWGRRDFAASEEDSIVRRFASLGVALVLAAGTLVPVAHAQSSGKTLVMGFTQEPDTFI